MEIESKGMGDSDKQLAALTEQRGKLSRQVGQAKKKGAPTEDLIAQVKELSLEIKALQDALAADRQTEASEIGESTDLHSADQTSNMPPLFVKLISGDSKLTENRQNLALAITEATELDQSDWDAFVREQAGSSVYHFWFFRKVIEQSFQHVCHYFIARSEQGRVCGILPSVELSSPMFGHFIVSMPYFTYGAALAESSAIEQALVDALIKKAKELGVSHVEIRKSVSGLTHLKEKSSKVSMVRALPKTKEAFWGEVGSKVRAQVKKAARFKLNTVFGREELLDDFYTVFAINMRDLGTPVYAKRFFANLLAEDTSKLFSIGVTYDGVKPVAACFLMGHKGMREIPWASSLRSAANKNANMAMYAAVLDDTIERSYAFFDFGRSSPDAGTYRFKKQWGAKPIQLYWYYWLKGGVELPELNPNNPKYKLLIAVWQRLPVWLSKMIGPLVVKYLP